MHKQSEDPFLLLQLKIVLEIYSLKHSKTAGLLTTELYR